MTSPETEQDDDSSEVEHSRMTLGEHLDELRTRLVRAAVALAVVFAVSWYYNAEVGTIALAPLEDKARVWLNEDLFAYEKARVESGTLSQEEIEEIFINGEVAATKLREPVPHARSDGAGSVFVYLLKVCGFASMFIAGPYVLWQVWAFIAAGLYRRERRAVYLYFPASVGLFFAGVLFGYFYLVPYAYYYLARMGIETIRHDPLIEPYLVFLKSLGLGMGIVFQLPILMMGASRAGLIDPIYYSKFRGHFIVGALVIAAVLTPPDPYTMVMMAAPMAILYEVGIVLARMSFKRAEKANEEALEVSR